VYALINKLLGNRQGPLPGGLAAAGLLFYAALAQFSPSVVRASVMIMTHIAARILRKRYDLLTGACAAAGAMLAINPLQLFHAGFQLSFLAIFSMAFAIPFLDRYVAPEKDERGGAADARQSAKRKEDRRREAARPLIRGFIPLFAIQAGMAPYTAYAFNYFSLMSFFLNVPVIFLSGVMIPIGVALIFLAGPGGAPFGIGASALEILTDIMSLMNEKAFSASWGHRPVVSPPAPALALYYGLFFALSSESFRILVHRKNRRALSGAAAALLCCVFLAWAPPGLGRDDSSLIFVDVGQGDCLHIRTPEGKNVLIDSGGSVNYEVGVKTLLPYLLKNGVERIDLALVTHLHTDHYRGLVELAGELPVLKLALYEGNRPREAEICRETGLAPEDLIYVSAGQRIKLGGEVYVDVLFPEKRSAEAYEALLLEEDENGSSLLMKLNYRGLSVLMTGDLGFEGEDNILRSLRESPEALRATLLKVGHHGSRYSTGDAFLSAVAPSFAVFQVGKNNFGHPHPTIIEKLEKAGIIFYRNDLSGAILFRVGKNGETAVRTMIPPGG
jgi:competence protein ComEC